MNNHQQKINWTVYSEEGQELSNMELPGERVLLVSGNRNFLAIYTNKQLLHIFSSSSTDLIKRGILIEGVCMMAQNQKLNKLAFLTFKGKIVIYSIKEKESQHMSD